MIVVDLGPSPAEPLSLNRERRMHWAARRRVTEPWKTVTFWVARQAHLARAVGGRPATITVVLPVRGHHRRDPANYYPTVKAVVDGLVLAGVWPDDTPDYVTVREPVLTHRGNAEIHLELREAGS